MAAMKCGHSETLTLKMILGIVERISAIAAFVLRRLK